MSGSIGQTSGNYTYGSFGPTNANLVLEAFDRIGMRPTQLDRHHMASARNSLNLALIDFENRGFSLWKLDSGTIDLVASRIVYTLPQNLVTLTELYYTEVDTTGGPNSIDRIMTPMTRQEYAAIPNKGVNGTPMMYWLQRLATPQISIWQPSAQIAPAFVLNWYGLLQFQDAGIGGGEVPDVIRRGIDALGSMLTTRLAEKFAPARLQEKAQLEAKAWENFASNDVEPGPFTFQPNLTGYARL